MEHVGTTSDGSEPRGLFIGIGRRTELSSLHGAEILCVDGVAAVSLANVEPAHRIRLHRDMVSACCRRGAFLPARLTTIQRSPHALRDFLTANAAQLCLALDRVDGYVEISVEIAGSEAFRSETQCEGSAVCGLDRLQHIASAVRIEAGLLDSQSIATVSGSASSPALKMALLAPSIAAFTIADRLERTLRQFARDYRTEVSGPWPPYSFSAPV